MVPKAFHSGLFPRRGLLLLRTSSRYVFCRRLFRVLGRVVGMLRVGPFFRFSRACRKRRELSFSRSLLVCSLGFRGSFRSYGFRRMRRRVCSARRAFFREGFRVRFPRICRCPRRVLCALCSMGSVVILLLAYRRFE